MVLPDGAVRVTTRADLGHESINVQLRDDATAPLEQLADRISGASGLNPTTAGFVLGEGAPRIARCADVERLVDGYRDLPLNDRQRDAIEHALACDVTFIWGPPGTGKTDVVARIVEGCFRQGQRVLFLAPTHVAVDQAVERICALLERADGFDGGLVQRVGDIALPSLQRRFGDRITPDLIVGRVAAELTRRATELRAQLDVIRVHLALHEGAAAAERRLHELTAVRDELERRAAGADDAVRRSSAWAQAARREQEGIGAPGGLFGQRKQRRIDALEADIRAHSGAAERARADRDHALAALPARRREQQSAAEEARQCRAGLVGVDPPGPLRHRERQLGDELDQAEKERREIASTVRARCRVLGSTLQKAVQSRPLMEPVDVVVIDEAGMVALPWAWCAAGLAGKRVVVAGDFRQLPSVTQGSDNRSADAEDRRHSRLWMDRDAFSAAGLVDAAGTARPDARMVCLDTQYRMRPAICAVVNEVAYPDAPLRTGRDDSTTLPGSALLPGPLVLVDTSTRRMPIGGHGAHRSNAVHEAVIHELIRGLQHDRVLPTRKAAAPSATDRMAVDVYCAFLDRQPVRTWLRRFAAPLAAGVRVTVYTRPQEPGPRTALVQELEAAGCRVEMRERMHEKVVIIDDVILWHGSLNLLAGVGPTDLMMRLTDPTACARVQRIMSVAVREKPLRTANGVQPGEVVDGRLYLRVPIEEKEEAKRLVRARWDPPRRLWHVAADTPRERVARWLPDG